MVKARLGVPGQDFSRAAQKSWSRLAPVWSLALSPYMTMLTSFCDSGKSHICGYLCRKRAALTRSGVRALEHYQHC